jgi:MacB-like periplasmic core domain
MAYTRHRPTEPDARRLLLFAVRRRAGAAAGVQRSGAVDRQPLHVDRRGDPEQIIGLQASAALLPTLGLQPVIGRSFSSAEDSRGGQHVVLISHAMWQQRFNGDPSVPGQALTLDGAPYLIIGVLPEAATAFPLNQFEIRIDPLALGFALAVSLVTGLAIGLLPAWQAASVNVQETLKEAGRGSVGSGGRLRSSLLVAEVSLSLVLLIAVGLLLTSFARLQQVKPGFEPGGVFTAQLALSPARYDRQRLVAFYEQLYQRLSTRCHRPQGGRRQGCSSAHSEAKSGVNIYPR